MDPLIGWAAPIVASVMTTVITTYLVAKVNQKLATEKDAVEAERTERAEWRASVDKRMDKLDKKLDTLNDATQTNMRTTLIHYCEKYLERGWVTPEERASIWDMHKKYAALNANGFIDSYISRVMELPDKEI